MGLRCLTWGRPGARGLAEEEERRKAHGSRRTQQTAPAPGVGSAQRLLSHPVRAHSAGEQMWREAYPFPSEMTYGCSGWDSRLTGGSEISHALAGEKQNQLFRDSISVFMN